MLDRAVIIPETQHERPTYCAQIQTLIEDYYTSNGRDSEYRISAPLTELINNLYQKLLVVANQTGDSIERGEIAIGLTRFYRELNSQTEGPVNFTHEINLPAIIIGETVNGATPTVKPKVTVSVDKSSGNVDVKIELECHERHLANPILIEMKRIIES